MRDLFVVTPIIICVISIRWDDDYLREREVPLAIICERGIVREKLASSRLSPQYIGCLIFLCEILLNGYCWMGNNGRDFNEVSCYCDDLEMRKNREFRDFSLRCIV